MTSISVNAAYKPLYDSDARVRVVYGGSGSGKSFAVAQYVLLTALQGRSWLVLRKVAGTLRYSVFAELCKMVQLYNCGDAVTIRKTDMSMEFASGARILFAGLDDVEKLKSISGIDCAWIEEATETVPDDFKQVNLRLRGENSERKELVLTFNPISAQHWIKRDLVDSRQYSPLVIKTTYADNAFIDEAYKAELEKYKDIDKTYHDIYARGEWGVYEGLVFNNWTVSDVSEDEWHYTDVVAGLDFGYNNPTALIVGGIKDSNIYIFREFYQSHLTNSQLIDALKGIVPTRGTIVADCAEPQRIAEMRMAGLSVMEAHKGRGSIESGLDWLKARKIFIAPHCINLISELQQYHYKTGTDTPLAVNDHAIDALRYATQPYRLAIGSSDTIEVIRGGRKVG